MLRLAIITHVRNQPLILERHFEAWRAYPIALRRSLEFVVVDDCSAVPVRDIRVKPANSILVRSHYRIPWNYMVKNYGVFASSSPAIFYCNADHVLNADACSKLLEHLSLLDKHYLLFLRRNPDPQADERFSAVPHVGSVCVDRRRFLAAGALDGEFSGHYGHDDTFLLHCLEQAGLKRFIPPDVVLENYSESRIIPDADFRLNPEWPRDLARNSMLLEQKKRNSTPRAATSCDGRWSIVRYEMLT